MSVIVPSDRTCHSNMPTTSNNDEAMNIVRECDLLT